ncbi:hypothetical protein C7W88_18940 (plasmid) [Novosphingobium sp. THN1]|uniref:hypothetical protein n=1 Tax=Novosphingobium sp. THN1 TaxID=1016987 RepID=UPI000E4F47A1|nr:hypothetical protein [Novosphingobium sp. THN1]AXU21053.1 hypothetical protein C7W88_18940 [Novosphingobium sp. THN1]
MVERTNLDRKVFAKGSQPVVFGDQTTDALAGMVLALLGEVVVLKDRLDANERLLKAAGLHGTADVDVFNPDAEVRAHRGAYRQAIYDRVLGVARDRLLPEALAEQQAYEGEVARVAAD